MQVFFYIARTGIDGDRWSKRKLAEHVTSYFHSLQEAGAKVQYLDLLAAANWDAYLVLVNVETADEALKVRGEVNRRCKLVHSKCRPYYFRARMMEVESIEELSIFGLTSDESKRFNEKAPKGVYREIAV